MGILKSKLVFAFLIFLGLLCISLGFDPVDNYLIDCGSSSNTTVGNSVFADDDVYSKMLSTPQNVLANITSNSISSPLGPAIYQIAGIFNGKSVYTVPIRKPGRHWIRLHFFPFVHPLYNMNNARFSVDAQQFTPLSNFQRSNDATVKEFLANITLNSLVLRFIPSDNWIVFLNALEMISVLDELITDGDRMVNPSGNYQGLWGQALATVPNSNFNVTWEFQVDPGFDYLVRLHFCDIVSTTLNQLVFRVYIISQAASGEIDLSQIANNILTAPYYMDFVAKLNGLRKLSVSIGPSANSAYPANAILNGVEVMKMNNSVGSLDGSFASPPFAQGKSKMKAGVVAGAIAGILILFVVAIIIFMICRKRPEQYQHSKTWVLSIFTGRNSHTTGSKFSNRTFGASVSNLGYQIPFAALQEATNKFNESWVIGVGGFGKVYKGVLKDGRKVAVKRGGMAKVFNRYRN